MTEFDLVMYVQDRGHELRERLEEAKRFGVNSPGFNQLLGAVDELQTLLDAMAAGAS